MRSFSCSVFSRIWNKFEESEGTTHKCSEGELGPQHNFKTERFATIATAESPP